ncbi:MAG: hypothetical protein ACLS95_00795, partial [Clostridia bacterium]
QNQLNSLNSLLSQTNATADKILAGYKAYSGGKLLTGTMANQGAVNSSLNCGQSYTIPAGYHNGSGKVTANSLASQTSATATSADILTGKTAWVNGQKLTGTNGGVENLQWNYKTFTSTPSANSSTMTWDLTSISNYQKLELYKTLNPVMVSSFDMSNWNTSQSRAWKVTWIYNNTNGKLSIVTEGGPIVQYGTGLSQRTVGIYYLQF